MRTYYVYAVQKLAHVDTASNPRDAIAREKQTRTVSIPRLASLARNDGYLARTTIPTGTDRQFSQR